MFLQEKIGRLKVDEKKRKETDEEERENIDSRPAAYNRMMGMDDVSVLYDLARNS